MSKIQAMLLLVMIAAVGVARAQAPTGIIAGVVTDLAGAAVPGGRITVTNRTTGWSRIFISSEGGDYSATSLPPGDYQITAEATGFSLLERTATVEVGTTTKVNLRFEIGTVNEKITVNDVAPLIRYDSHQVGGLISRNQIENLPLNGRHFLELAKLEPGVQPPTRASSNRTFVPALGQPQGNNGRGTRVTVDGGSIMAVGNGGSAMGFSQEVVHEFQITTVNFDLTTGLTNGAAINVATRSGGNQMHGTGFYFFRDHTLAAYPALKRDLDNPDPIFRRQQFGFALGGPIRRDRVFFFGTYERNQQLGVVATALGEDFEHLNRITPSPYHGNQFSLRLDGRLTNAHTGFMRYSHDGVQAFGPPTLQPNAYPSFWVQQPLWADQSILGFTSVLRDTLVNDLRFSYFFVSSSTVAPTERECPGCLGVGAPSITVDGADLSIGRTGVQQKTLARRFHLTDYVTWQKSAHRMRFGVDWEYNRGGTLSWNSEPAALILHSPKSAHEADIDIPSAFLTLEDILKLPLQSVTVGIGDPRVPQENGSLVPSWNTLRLFFQDTWRLNSRLTVNYGLGWSVDHALNDDLTKPALLAPILGADGLGPTRTQWKNFSPVLGLSWAPRRDEKTVIRAGAGIFYDFVFNAAIGPERAVLGPPGLGRQLISGSRIPASICGISGGASLDFPNTPTRFTGADLLSCLPMIRADLAGTLADQNQSIQAIQLTKQASGLNPVDAPRSSALHVNVGVQRQVAREFVMSADFVYRHFDHLGMGQLDLNHSNSVRGPVVPKCEGAQRNDPQALCSTGPIRVQVNAGRTTYKGLLVRADKRFSHGFQMLGAWAYSSNTGTYVVGGDGGLIPGFNLDDWLGNRGPLDRDITHIVNLAGVVQLPWRFQLGLNFSYASAPPLSAFVGGNDFNGDGTTGDLLPGTTVNAFNRGMGRSELESLVAQFNQTKAGTFDAKGEEIHTLTLPEHYWFGDNFHALDLRLSRELVFRERWHVLLIGEAFNVYNAANLSGYSGNLTTTFGQPTSRATQVFGSGGPRAFQLGMRVSF
jgi:hypothetical protein